MVEQIDRMTAREILRGDEDRAAAIIGKVRAAERARMIARMRQPDAAMVERVLMAGYILTEEDTRAALSAAADHMEAGDAAR